MKDIEYLKSIDSPTLSNAIELLKVRPRERGFTPLEIRCLFPELGAMCGYAVTAQVESATQMEPFRLETFVELYHLVQHSPKPAVIVLQEISDNILVPRILGSSLHLHPVAILVFALIAANLAGLVGLLLSAPILATLRLFGQYIYSKMFDLNPWPEPPPITHPSAERAWARWARLRISMWREARFKTEVVNITETSETPRSPTKPLSKKGARDKG